MHIKYCATKINITTYRRLIKEYNTIQCIAISVAAVTITQTLINIATYGPKSLKTANYHQPTNQRTKKPTLLEANHRQQRKITYYTDI
jgi:hypothetical protein